jgi:hypothetical protein
MFGVMSVLIALVVVGVLSKNQWRALPVPPTSPQNSSLAHQAVTGPHTPSGVAPLLHGQQIQQQIKKSVEAAMQQPRPIPGE